MDDPHQVLLLVGTYTRKESFVDGKGQGIHVFTFDTRNGVLKPHCITPNLGINPAFSCGPTRTHRVIYVINECNEPLSTDPSKETGYIVALRLDVNGKLHELNRQETKGSFPCHVSLDPSHHFVLVSNYGGGSLILFPINESDGSLDAACAFLPYEGASRIHPMRQEAAHMHSATWMQLSTGEHFVYAADLGNDRVVQLKLNPTAKSLVAFSDSHVTRPPGAGPRHMAFHPSRSCAFVLDELSNTIGVHAFDASTGILAPAAHQNIATLPSDFDGVSLSADIHVSDCGNFVYASNRGHDSIACYRFASNRLELIGFESTRGQAPRNFCIYHHFLLVGNQDTSTIQVFSIDPETGSLAFTGQSIDCPTPVSLVVAE